MAMTRLRNQQRQLQSLLEQEKVHGKELQGEIEQLRETLSFTQHEFRTQMLSNRDELNAANQQLQAVHELALKHGITQRQLEESLQQNSETPQQQPEQKDELDDDNQRVMTKLSQSEQIVQSLRENIARLQKDEAAYKATMLGQQQKINELGKEIQSFRSLPATLASTKAHNARLQLRVDEMTSSNAVTSQSLKSTTAELHALKQAVEARSRETHAALEAELLGAKASNQSLHSKLNTLESSYNSLQESLKSCKEEMAATEKRWKSEMSTLKTDLAHARSHRQQQELSAQKEIDELQKQKVETEELCTEKLDKLTQQVEKLTQSNKELDMRERKALARAEESNRLNKELQGAGSADDAPNPTEPLQHQQQTKPQLMMVPSDDYERRLNELKTQLRKEARRSERLRVQLQEAQEMPQLLQVSQATDTTATTATTTTTTVEGDANDSAEEARAALLDCVSELQAEKITMLEKVSYLETSMHKVVKELAASRAEVVNLIRRVRCGSLSTDEIIEPEEPQAWSTRKQREELFHKMRFVLHETNLQNLHLTEMKDRMGQEINKLHADLMEARGQKSSLEVQSQEHNSRIDEQPQDDDNTACTDMQP